MKELLKLVGVLTLIALGAGLLLSSVSRLTAEPIARAEAQVKLEAIREVLPAFDNAPQEDVVVVEGRHTNYVARLNGVFAGAAFETVSPDGYGGEIRVMVGVNRDSKVQGIKILQHKETPGLGAKIETREFRNTFGGASIDSTDWRVTKDGGDVDAITAATISSRAVAGAVGHGLAVYSRNRQHIEGLPR